MDTEKKCPMCAEQIPLEAQVCSFCGARFLVAKVGYCTSCHAKREADETDSCRVCENPLTDVHMESELVQIAVAKPAQPAPPVPVHPQGRKTHVSVAAILGILFVCAGVIVITLIIDIPSVLPLLEPSNRTPFPTRTLTSTITPRPTLTPKPAQVEVDFTSIYNYPLYKDVIIVGQLVLPSSVRCDEHCGVFLRNPMKFYERITIFLFIPLADSTPLPNQMARLPHQYSEQDFEVRLDNGNYVGNYATVRITGSICETTDGDIAICNISKIESQAAPAPDEGETVVVQTTPAPGEGEISQFATGAIASSQYSKPSWSAMQAVGAPDTADCGDLSSAWASLDSSGKDWLLLTYDQPVIPTRIVIYQTYNPSAVTLVEVVDEAGNSSRVYEARPTIVSKCPYMLEIEVKDVNKLVRSIRITIDQSIHNGWNEIDAVQLLGKPK